MTHEEFVREIADIVGSTHTNFRGAAESILALIAERLKEPTEAMLSAAEVRGSVSKSWLREFGWPIMLAASPLVPP